MQMQIWKALQRRGKAIRVALNKYNRLAKQLQPPAPPLEWKDVVNYMFVAEFEILKHSYSYKDVTNAPWVSQSTREGISKYYKVQRAKEEIICLNVEIKRLSASIQEENQFFEASIETTSSTNTLLSLELATVYKSRHRVNNFHLQRLDAFEAKHGFADLSKGLWPVSTPTDIMLTPETDDGSEDEPDLELDDDLNDDMNRFGDFVENMSDSSTTVNTVPSYMLTTWKL
jgi:hypothetical protein